MRVTRLGCKPESYHQRLRYKRAPMASGVDTGLVTLAHFSAPVFDQGPTGSCEGHRFSQALVTAANAAGNSIKFIPSPLGIYRDARLFERRADAFGKFPPLFDGGCATGDVLTALATVGIRPIGRNVQGRVSDCSPDTINDDPTLTDLAQEAAQYVSVDANVYDIDLSNQAVAAAQIQAALKSGYPVAVDVFVDTIFERWGESGSKTPVNDVNLQDPNGGGHALLITEMFVSSSGDTTYSIINSWGDWGLSAMQAVVTDHGYARVTPKWLATAGYGGLAVKVAK